MQSINSGSIEMTPTTSRTVYLNPNFKNTHINPNFLITKPASSIHVNPAFLKQLEASKKETNTEIINPLKGVETAAKANANMRLVKISRTKIVREPLKQQEKPQPVKNPLVKIGLRKLVRASTFAKSPISHKNSTLIKGVIKNKLFPLSKAKYKIDRRKQQKSHLRPTSSIKKRSFVSRYALRRGSINEKLLSKKVIITKKKLLRIGSTDQLLKHRSIHPASLNKKLELLNINGVLYKSSRNKLQKTNIEKPTNIRSKNSIGRVVVVRGKKFVLDKSGKSLTGMEASAIDDMKLKRIDIGHLTYVAKSRNVFIRTETHKARHFLNNAKQKSINTLFKKLVKSNVPCPIFRKVGKCAAFERGKCPKIHDKIHVTICAKFLKGECSNEKCLLSHEVNLSKMPTCKFFLQGCCVRDDCPYLHKKLSGNAEICLDFLKGFCHLAEKCDKRHEFLCPDFEKTGKCNKVKCSYCRRKDKLQKMEIKKEITESVIIPKQECIVVQCKDESKEKFVMSRYFIDETDEVSYLKESEVETNSNPSLTSDFSDKVENNILVRRPKLGELPSFIPL